MTDDNANVFDTDAVAAPVTDDNTTDDPQATPDHDFGDQKVDDGF